MGDVYTRLCLSEPVSLFNLINEIPTTLHVEGPARTLLSDSIST